MVTGRNAFDLCVDETSQLFIAGSDFKRNKYVENKIGVSHARYKPEIVYRKAFIDSFYAFVNIFTKLINKLVIGFYRIKVNDTLNTVFFKNIAFYKIDYVMALENIITSVNFSMESCKATARTVVMYHHVVNPEDFGMRTGFGFDFFDELRIRCGSDYVIFVFIQNFSEQIHYFFFTVTLHFFVLSPLLTVIVTLPAFFALILPLEDTVAIFLFDDLYVILSTLPSSTDTFKR